MKIVCIGPTAPYKGGISHYNTLLCQSLSKYHDLELISWKRRYPAFLYPAEQFDKASKKKISSDAKFILDCLNPFTWCKACKIIKKKKADLLIFHWVTPFLFPIFYFISIIVKTFLKTKILLICHNVLPHERGFLDKYIAMVFFSTVDYFIVHSKEDLSNLQRIKSKAKVKLGFANFDIFNDGKYNTKKTKKKLNLNKNVILFFGFVRKYKGLDYLLKAMPEILDSIDLQLLVVGEFWEDKSYYVDLINQLNIKNNIKLVDNYVPNEEVGKYFLVSDVVVLPYVSATQSGIIQISFSFNKPVISTRVGGLGDVVLEGKTGYLVEPKNPSAIAKAVIKFYKNIDKVDFSKWVEKEKKKFSWDRYIYLIEDFL
ncbi:MAG: glycosyltransferase [Candidatus Omnitrophica bacterium]|nr:glycosyltransferase [Candidatus Omnitrophota bacterium]